MILDSMPSITNHAYDRALERLHVSGTVFYGWVRATHADWIPIDVSFLHQRQIKVSARGSHHFITPWTAATGVALCLSEDKWVKTLMPFAQTAKPTGGDDIYARLVGKLMLNSTLNARQIAARAIGVCGMEGACVEDAVEAFIADRIDVGDLRQIITTKSQYRAGVLEHAIERVSGIRRAG